MKRIAVSVPTIHHVSHITAHCESVKEYSFLSLELSSSDGDTDRLFIFFTGEGYSDYVARLTAAINSVTP